MFQINHPLNKTARLLSFSVFLIICSCSGDIPVKNEVVIHELANPEMLNPINTADASSVYINNHMFQKLIDIDFRNPENLVPVLAEKLPQIEKTSEGRMHITFQLRKEARWDNGSPVTVKDIDFTLKTIKCPLVNNQNVKSVFEFITGIELYKDDSLKFTVLSDRPYFLAEAAFTDISIIPEYIYDPKGILRNFTVKQLAAEGDQLKLNPLLNEFANDFNSEKRMRDPNYISGSGAYKFTEWKTNERIVLTKKENWWGNFLEKENCYFEAYPEKLTYQIIKDPTTSIVALKAGNIDVMRTIKVKDFIELPKSEKFVKNFNAYTPMWYAYTFIGINNKRPILSDKLTRQALAYLTDTKKMIQTLRYGMAEQVIGPIHPSKKKNYNSAITPYDFNPEKARDLLQKAGWKNTNGDETLDKMIDGKPTEFIIDYYCNSESEERKSIGLMLQAEAKKLGIKINIVTNDYGVFLDKCKNHDFDLMCLAWIVSPGPDDLKQSYHSTSAIGEGSNYYNFSNSTADSLIDAIRSELNEERRSMMYKRLQEILHEEVPVLFLWAPSERIAISKKFENAYPSLMGPGFWVNGFRVKGMNN